jgi:hypothetical protein
MKADIYTEIYLWNKNVDALVRVLGQLDTLGIRPKPELKGYELRLEEIRAALNADFAEAAFARERADHLRLNERRSVYEQQAQTLTFNKNLKC